MTGVGSREKRQDRSAERAVMVETQLVPRGIRDVRVLEAMRTICREEFVPPPYWEDAYADRALAVGYGQTISQPYIVAYMTEWLGVGPQHHVLEVGTGTGYQTTVLARLARCVVTMERIAELSDSARGRVARADVSNVTFVVGDGGRGATEFGPFDRIMVTAAAPRTPCALLEQLCDGGRMVLPVGDERDQRLVLVERRGGQLIETNLIRVRFVPLLGEAGFSETY